MNRRDKVIVGGVVGVLLLGFSALAVASGGDKKDDKKGCGPGKRWSPGLKKCVPTTGDDKKRGCGAGMRWSPGLKKCVPISCPAGYERDKSGNCVKKGEPNVVFCPVGQKWNETTGECEPVDDDDCPPGMVRNAARLRLLGMGLSATELAAELLKYPLCVPKSCAKGFTRNEFGECVSDEGPPCLPGFERNADGDCEPSNIVCADGFSKNADGECVKDNDGDCPDGFRWDFIRSECVPKCDDGQFWDATARVCRDKKPGGTGDIDWDDIIKDFPEDNAFYQIKYKNIMGWGLASMHRKAITQNVLGRALFIGAREYGGMANADAQKFADQQRKNPELTNLIYNAILCCGWNDMLYGTWGYWGPKAIERAKKPDMRNHAGEHGRSIRPLTQHADNADRMRQGLPPARTVAVLTSESAGNGRGDPVAKAVPGGDSSYPLIWIPGIDRQALWNSGGYDVRFISSQANPPKQITDLSFEDFSKSWLSSYGCQTSDYNGELVK